MHKVQTVINLLLLNILALFVILPGAIFPQDRLESDNAERRARWFSTQRSYPFDTVPQNVYDKALEVKKQLRREKGYYLSISNSWESIGPSPLYQSFPVPVSGRFSSVKFAPSNPSIIYAGAASGGLWKSTNGGVNWINLTDYNETIGTLSSGAIAVDPSNPNIVYYGTGEGIGWSAYIYYGRGIFKSLDGGITWTKATINGSGGSNMTYVSRIVIDPSNSQTLYAATCSHWRNETSIKGLYKSTDAGMTWNRVVPDPSKPGLNCSDVKISQDGRTVYCCGGHDDGGMFAGVDYRISTDFGNTFTRITSLDGVITGYISLSKTNQNVLYAVSPYDAWSAYLYKSTDGGYNYLHINTFASGQAYYDLSVDVNPFDANHVYVCWGDAVNHSTDGGNNFRLLASGYYDNHFLDCHPTDPNTVAIVNDGGVWINNGTSLLNCNYDINAVQFYKISVNPFNPDNILGGTQDHLLPMKSLTANAHYWDVTGSAGDMGMILFDPVTNGNVIGCGANCCGYLYRSYDGGLHSVPVTLNGGPYIWDSQTDWIAPMAFNPSIPGLCYTARRLDQTSSPTVLITSTDYGTTWNPTYTVVGTGGSSPQQIAVSQSNPQVMYMTFSSFAWPYIVEPKVFKSTNAGVNWVNLDVLNHGLPFRAITSIRVDASNENIVYLTLSGFGSGHVYRSTSGGISSWVDISYNLPDVPVNDFIMYQQDCYTMNYVIATDLGVYCMPENSNSWSELGTNLPNAVVLNIDFNAISGKLMAGTYGRGAWQIDLKVPVFLKGNVVIQSDYVCHTDLVVCPGSKLTIPASCLIRLDTGKKIIIMDGATLDVSSGKQVVFDAFQGLWGGIEFQGSSTGTLRNCVFNNTTNPIVINGNLIPPATPFLIDTCTFAGGPISVNSGNNVIIQRSVWKWVGSYTPDIYGISLVGSENITVTNNVIAPIYPRTSTGIFLVYGNNISIQNNTVENVSVGMVISNSSPFVDNNLCYISHGVIGIGMDNSNSAVLNDNTLADFRTGFRFGNSSPTLLQNRTKSFSSYPNDSISMEAVYYSSPRLRPTSANEQIIIDAGYNQLKAVRDGIYLSNFSYPDVDYGYNLIFGENRYNMCGDVAYGGLYKYFVRCNSWGGIPTRDKFYVSNAIMLYEPYDCSQITGGGNKELTTDENAYETSSIFPEKIIVDYKNCIYDTLKVTRGKLNLSEDKSMLSSAMKHELSGEYTNAIEVYKQVVLDNFDNTSKIEAMRRILNCGDKQNLNKNFYSQLREFYLNLISSNQGDTIFLKAASDLAAKTLVRMGEYPSAITEYENIISKSHDPMEIKFSELNIIETYMLMNSRGNSYSNFSGKLSNLKPENFIDGFRMIGERFYKQPGKLKDKNIPKEFKLLQNYPNPFNPTTKIQYNLPQNSKVIITVYDILGRTVKVLANEYKEAGTYTVLFDGSGFASGIYFYKIEAGSFIESKKMVLIK